MSDQLIYAKALAAEATRTAAALMHHMPDLRRAGLHGFADDVERLTTAVREWRDRLADGIATPEEVAEARARYADDSGNAIEVDDDTLVSRAEGGVWVGGWLWVATSTEDN